MASSPYKKSTSITNHSSNKADDAVQLFTDMMIEKMTALKNQKWEKGWFNGQSFEGLPQNYSGRNYNGSNTFFLYMNTSMKGYSMPVYLTFDQARKNDIKINKGEKSFPVLYWNLSIKDKNGDNLSFEDYRYLSKEEREKCHVKPFLKTYPVFNVDQTNLKEVKPEEYEKLKKKFEIPEIKDTEGMYTHNALDNVVKNQTWVCPVQTDKPSDRAFYSPSRDIVVLPMKAQFKKHESEEEIYRDGMEFYSTMLHEMAHSTGHKDRLNRLDGSFGDPKYAKEELVAELTAAMIGNSMGFDSKITDNSAKYLDNWLGALHENPKFIVSVMADVNKASDMILEKVDEQRLALGETPYLSKNMVAVENEHSLEPEFKTPQELIASEPYENSYGKIENQNVNEPALSYYGRLSADEKDRLYDNLVNQYKDLKRKHPDAIILFRVSDNYLLFNNDAKRGKEILGLETKEFQASNRGLIRFSEFDHNDLDKFLPQIVKAGQRVAISETAIQPKKFVKRGMSEEIPKEKSYNELSGREQQKKQRELVKEFSKDETVAIINSYQKKYEPKNRQFQEGELPIANSLLFHGLINYHQYYAASTPKEYAKFCLESEVEPGYATAKELYRNHYDIGPSKDWGYPSTGEILHQREQKVDKHNNHELKILTVEEICLNIKNPTPFLNDLEKKGLLTEPERNKVEELLKQPIMSENKVVAQLINPLNDLSIERLNELPVGTKITVTDLTSNYDVEIKTKQENGLWETAVGNGKGYTVIPDMEPKAIMGNFERMASAEKEWDSKLKYILSAPSLKQDLNDNLNNDNTMAKTKKSDESVSEKKEKKVKEPKMPGGFNPESGTLEDIKADTKKGNKVEIKPEVKAETKQEAKAEEKKEEAVKQPREPQLITVNGDKVSHAHIYKAKDTDENLFIAKINGNYLRPTPIPKEVAADFIEKKVSVDDMMQRYYPTKLMPRVSEEDFKNQKVISGKQGDMTIEKFNVYKEKDQTREDFGKYKFYAKVDGKSMSTLASQNDLNAYFDRVQTPKQMVERIFGDRLKLESHYQQFKLPEGFNPKEGRMVKDKNSNNYVVYLDMGEAGRTKGKIISRDDKDNYFNKIATKDQLVAKYLGHEINTRMGMTAGNKISETKQLKL